jgi:SAM-dependent methyltransferase
MSAMTKTVLKSQHCLCCNSEEIVEIDTVSSKDVINAYKINFRVDIEKLFNSESSIVTLFNCKECDLKWYEPMIAGDAKFYEALQQHDWYYQEQKPEYDFARKNLKEGDHILEVGCGSGAFGKMMPRNTTYHGLEFNQTALDKATKAGLKVTMESIDNHSFQNTNAYDVVCHFQVLEHVTEPLKFLESCVRALKPGGRLIVVVPSEDSFLSVTESLWLNMPPHHLTRWSDNALIFAMKSLKLEKIDIWHEPVADFHKNFYRSSMINFGFKHLIGLKTKLLKNKILSRVTGRIEKTTSLGNWLAKVGEKHFELSKIGHTVCIIAYKSNEVDES